VQEQLRIHRQIVYDIALHYLEPLPGNFARLAYLAGLKNSETGVYTQTRLAATYGEARVHDALSKCHEELLEKLLEMPLAQQEQDLRHYVESLSIGWPEAAARCRELLDSWMPVGAPDYLKELFRSNLNALCDLLHENKPKARSGK
jgi:hypothetical protein